MALFITWSAIMRNQPDHNASSSSDVLPTMLARLRASTCEAERALVEEEIVRDQLPMTRAIARRYANRGVDLEDLTAVAALALVKAIRGFEPALGSFQGYATATVLGEIKKHFRDHCWTVRPTRRIQELQSEIVHVTAERQQQLESVRPEALADALGAEVSEVTEAMGAFAHFRAMSLDAPAAGGGSRLGDRLASDDRDLDLVDQRLMAVGACAELTPVECRLLRLRFVEDRTQSEIATILGTSQVQVSRHLTRALQQLRQKIGELEPPRKAPRQQWNRAS
jgi:RNA polymerase sigma-B factor